MSKPPVFHEFNQEITKILQNDGVGIIPTDTVYGLVCLAKSMSAVKRLYDLKSRVHKPGTVLAADIKQLSNLGIKKSYLKSVAHFWPNPISIEISHNLSYLNMDTGRQAFRIPKDAHLLDLLQQTGPLQSSSANLPGELEAATIKQAQNYFGDRVDFYLDGGNLVNRQASTIIRVIDNSVEVIRQGAVKIDENGGIT